MHLFYSVWVEGGGVSKAEAPTPPTNRAPIISFASCNCVTLILEYVDSQHFKQTQDTLTDWTNDCEYIKYEVAKSDVQRPQFIFKLSYQVNIIKTIFFSVIPTCDVNLVTVSILKPFFLYHSSCYYYTVHCIYAVFYSHLGLWYFSYMLWADSLIYIEVYPLGFDCLLLHLQSLADIPVIQLSCSIPFLHADKLQDLEDTLARNIPDISAAISICHPIQLNWNMTMTKS